MKSRIIFGLLLMALLLNIKRSLASDTTTVAIHLNNILSKVNSKNWGIGAPDKYSWWPGNNELMLRIKEANIKFIRVGPVQLGIYTNHDLYPSENNWNYSDLDLILNTIWDAGAQPLFIVSGYPAGVNAKDWNAYAVFMQGVVNRYNVEKALGANKTITYFEMWNEPTIEGDGTLTKEEFKQFVEVVGGKMKETDPTIQLVGPADAWANLGNDGFVKYTSVNLSEYIDVLSWHDYGPDPDDNDAVRMAWTKQHYYSNIVAGRTQFGNFKAGITEYNISHADGGDEYNKKYHNEFAATYFASAILNAMKAEAEMFTSYNLAESGTNLLGVLQNTDYKPYKPYYAFYMFGNYNGELMLETKGGTTDIEHLATIDTVNNKCYITVVNKNVSGKTYELKIDFEQNNISGYAIVRKLDVDNNPTDFVDAFSFEKSGFVYSIAPLSVVNFELGLNEYSDIQNSNIDEVGFKVFPNPIKDDEFTIISAQNMLNSQLIIYNLQGQIVKKLHHDFQSLKPYQVNISGLHKGIYVIKLSNNYQIKSKIIVVE